MTKFKHFETESGKTIMTAQFDGYSIAERMLEGLQFQITIQPDGTLKAWVKPEDEDFFSDFNTTKFLKMAVEYAEENDIFDDPESGEECWLVSEGNSNQPQNKPLPIVVQKVNPISVISATASTHPHSCGTGCNHNHTPTTTSTTSSIIDQILGETPTTKTEEEVKEPVIGKFKPKRKFLNFVIGKKGGIRYHTDYAFLKAEQLSGMLEGVIFKITLCDEGTINFEECDTNQCNDEMIQRFIDDIDSRDVTGYMKKYVIHSLEFQDEDGKKLYLEVDEAKPIDKLTSLFDSLKEEETKTEEIMEEVKVSDSALSLLDSLFGEEVPTQSEVEVKVESEIPQETYAQQMMREAFEEMNREKIAELTERIEKKEKDISQTKQLIKQNESNLKSDSEDYRVLQSRLESLKPADPANGYVFYVSPENKSGVVLDQALQDVVKQISPLLKLKEDAVIDYLTKGFFTIKIAKKDNLTDENLSIEKEVYEKINKIDVTGKMSIVGNGEFEYRGEMTWHKLVDKMLKMGFEQEPEYDKLCGSPSYQSEDSNDMSDMKNSIIEMAKGLGIENVAKQHLDSLESVNDNDSFSNKPLGKEYVNFTEPTTIVIFGESPQTPRSIQITDDETCFSLFIGEKKVRDLGSMGFADVFTLEEYKKYYNENKEMFSEYEGLIYGHSGVVVPNFVGKVEVTAFREINSGIEFTKNFNFNDYIEHQIHDVSVGILLPEGTQVVDLNEDCSLPVQIIRDIKIDSIVK
jgi:hypothetical protein